MHLNVLHRYQLNIITSLEIFDTTTSLIDTSLFPHFVHKERGHGQSDFSWTVVALYSYVPLMSVFLCIITSELCRLPYCSSTIKKIDNNGVNPEYSITERGWFGIRSQIICIVSRVSGKGWNDSEARFWSEFSIIMTYLVSQLSRHSVSFVYHTNFRWKFSDHVRSLKACEGDDRYYLRSYSESASFGYRILRIYSVVIVFLNWRRAIR